MPPPNKYVQAFKEHPNLIGLASTFALSAATLNPLPLLVGLVAEAAYLIFVPDSKWYDARLSQRYDAEVARRREQLKNEIFPSLPAAYQDRFNRLEETHRQIATQMPERQRWFREVLRKLEFLLEKFLQFAHKEMQFRAYLQSLLDELRTEGRGGRRSNQPDNGRDRRDNRRDDRRLDPRFDLRNQPQQSQASPPVSRDPRDAWVERTSEEVQAAYAVEIQGLEATLAAEKDENTRAVLEKRIEVLRRRTDFVGKIQRILINLSHQLKLVEDTFGLINDELCARSPEQVLADIEDVVWQTNSMTELLEEVAPFQQILEKMPA